MTPRVERAAELHAEGHNCSQAVACVCAEDLGCDHATLFAVTEGLGRGMGDMGGTCGALSGACVALGMACGTGDPARPTSKAATYRVCSRARERFAELAGSTCCRDLKGVDTGVPLCSCRRCVEIGAQVVDELLPEARGWR